MTNIKIAGNGPPEYVEKCKEFLSKFDFDKLDYYRNDKIDVAVNQSETYTFKLHVYRPGSETKSGQPYAIVEYLKPRN